MKYLTFALALALLAGLQLTLVLGAAAEKVAGDALHAAAALPYKLSPATWIGEVDGEAFNLTGTVDSVHAELTAKHPNFDFEAHASTVSLNGTSDNSAAVLMKRSRKWPPLCVPIKGQNWQPALVDRFYQCADKIRGSGANAALVINPRTCSLICCRREGRIHLCNDEYHNVVIGDRYLADSISMTCKECSKGWNGLEDYTCGGQLFDTDGTNVILARGSGGCDPCKPLGFC